MGRDDRRAFLAESDLRILGFWDIKRYPCIFG